MVINSPLADNNFKSPLVIRLVWLVAWLCFLSSSIKGQKYVYSTVNGIQDLSGDIRGLVADTLGYTWLATDKGLWRNNGSNIESFNQGLRSHDLRSIIYSDTHHILISNDAGIVQVDPYTSPPEFQMLVVGSESTIGGQLHYPNKLMQDATGRIWFTQANNGIGVIDNEGLRVLSLDGYCIKPDTKINIVECEGEIIVYGGGDCVLKIDRNFKIIPVSLIGQTKELHGMTVLDGKLYFYGRGVQKAELTYNAEKITLGEFIRTDYTVTTLSRSRDGTIYAGTKKNSLKRVVFGENKLELRHIYMANDPHRVEELPDKSIRHIYCNEENIWLVSEEGLSYLQRRYFETIASLPNLNAINIYHDNDVSYVSVGSLYKIDNVNGELRAQSSNMGSGYTPNYVQRQGDILWVSTTTGELLGYSGGRLIRKINLSWRGSGIFNLFTDQKENMWFCQSPQNNPIIGLAKIRSDGTLMEYGKSKGLENRILAFDEGPNGTLYVAGIGEQSILYKYDQGQDVFYNLSLPLEFEVGANFEVHDLDVDDKGVVWLASTDGLIRYDLDRFTRVDLGTYTSTEIRGIAAVGENNYWISTDTYGLLHFDGGQNVILDEDSGMPSRISSYRTLDIDPKGRVWAGTAEGLVYTRSSNPKPNLTNRPLLRQVICDGKILKLNHAGIYHLNDNAKSEISYKSIEYPGRSLEYRYRLVDKFGNGEWVSLDHEDRLVLENISKGIIAVEIAAMNHIGKSWSDNLIVPIRIVKPWYRTLWAYFLYASLLITAIVSFVRMNLSKLMKRIRKLESALAVTEHEYQREKDEKIEDRHRLDLIFRLSEIFKEAKTEKDVIKMIGEAMEHSFDIDLIEIGIYNLSKEHIHYFGYDASLDVITERHESFMSKEHIGAYALHHNETLLFKDYNKQHHSFVTREDDEHPYASQIIIPFELKDKRKAILHLGAELPGLLLQRDVEMFFILTTMIDSIDITRDL